MRINLKYISGLAVAGMLTVVGCGNHKSSNNPGIASVSTNSPQSPPTPPTITAPLPPSGLAAVTSTASIVGVSWQDNSTDEDGFIIQRRQNLTGAYADIATVGKDLTSYQDTSLAQATQYEYRVRAFNAGGDSQHSNQDTDTTFPDAASNTQYVEIAPITSLSSVVNVKLASGLTVPVVGVSRNGANVEFAAQGISYAIQEEGLKQAPAAPPPPPPPLPPPPAPPMGRTFQIMITKPGMTQQPTRFPIVDATGNLQMYEVSNFVYDAGAGSADFTFRNIGDGSATVVTVTNISGGLEVYTHPAGHPTIPQFQYRVTNPLGPGADPNTFDLSDPNAALSIDSNNNNALGAGFPNMVPPAGYQNNIGVNGTIAAGVTLVYDPVDATNPSPGNRIAGHIAPNTVTSLRHLIHPHIAGLTHYGFELQGTPAGTLRFSTGDTGLEFTLSQLGGAALNPSLSSTNKVQVLSLGGGAQLYHVVNQATNTRKMWYIVP